MRRKFDDMRKELTRYVSVKEKVEDDTLKFEKWNKIS